MKLTKSVLLHMPMNVTYCKIVKKNIQEVTIHVHIRIRCEDKLRGQDLAWHYIKMRNSFHLVSTVLFMYNLNKHGMHASNNR